MNYDLRVIWTRPLRVSVLPGQGLRLLRPCVFPSYNGFFNAFGASANALRGGAALLCGRHTNVTFTPDQLTSGVI